eukprot:960317_1
MARFKEFLHHSCMLAVCVTVVLHSFSVGVLGASFLPAIPSEENVEKKAEALEKVLNGLEGLLSARADKVEFKKAVNDLLVWGLDEDGMMAKAREELKALTNPAAKSSNAKAFGGGVVAGGAVGLAAGKYLFGAGPASKDDTPTGDADGVEDEG